MTNSFIYLPRTLTPKDSNSMITVASKCVQNALPTLIQEKEENSAFALIQPPMAICKADGTWHFVGNSKCECNPGFIPSLKTSLCTGNLLLFFEDFQNLCIFYIYLKKNYATLQ